jgi:hypothetical protein
MKVCTGISLPWMLYRNSGASALISAGGGRRTWNVTPSFSMCAVHYFAGRVSRGCSPTSRSTSARRLGNGRNPQRIARRQFDRKSGCEDLIGYCSAFYPIEAVAS